MRDHRLLSFADNAARLTRTNVSLVHLTPYQTGARRTTLSLSHDLTWFNELIVRSMRRCSSCLNWIWISLMIRSRSERCHFHFSLIVSCLASERERGLIASTSTRTGKKTSSRDSLAFDWSTNRETREAISLSLSCHQQRRRIVFSLRASRGVLTSVQDNHARWQSSLPTCCCCFVSLRFNGCLHCCSQYVQLFLSEQ